MNDIDIVSFLLGKSQGGGGSSTLQEKSVTITSNGSNTVLPDSGYDGLSKVNLTTNVTPNLETKSITITQNGTTNVTPTTGKDGLSSVEITTNVSEGQNWSQIGYSAEPPFIDRAFNYAKDIYDNWDSTITSLANYFTSDTKLVIMPLVDTSNVTTMSNTFKGCSGLKQIPLLNTEHVTSVTSLFENCTLLEDVPVLNFSSVTANASVNYLFAGCVSLTDESLDNILLICIGMTSYGGTKTLVKIGIKSANYPASKIEALPHYQDFINAGWTTGY